MARSKRQLIGKWINDDGDMVWVYKGGRDFWISYRDSEHLCHPSIRSVNDTKREAMLVFHVSVTSYSAIG